MPRQDLREWWVEYPQALDRFLSRVNRSGDGCFEWTGRLDTNGYGAFTLTTNQEVRAHRLAFELWGPGLPDDLEIDHLCRNPRCCRENHLEAVTHAENVRRGSSPAAYRANQTHCINGHEFTPENTYVRREGWRMCRECSRLRWKTTWRKTDGRFTHCKSGHEFTPENTYTRANGERRCRICMRIEDRARYERRKAAAK